MVRCIATGVALALLLAARGAGAREGDWIKTTVCAMDAERREAAQALDAFDGLLARQPSLVEVSKAWTGLLDRSCLRLPAKLVPFHELASVEQLAAWWREGGELFLRSYLSPSDGIFVAAAFRRGWAETMKQLERRHSTVPAPLVCARPDQSCDPDAVETMLTLEHRDRSEERLRGRAPDTKEKPSRYCLEQARKLESRLRFSSFVSCMAASAGQMAARYPVVGFRLPRTGWLVMVGRRGHYQFCDEVRAYDLESGSAYVAASCGGLVLRDGGQVNGAATADTVRPDYKVGRMSLDAVRRITFLLATAAVVDTETFESTHVELPKGMAPVWWEQEGSSTGFGFGAGVGGWFSSSQTAIGWTWRDGGQVLASGRFVWPTASDAVDDAVDERLRLAEAAMIEGCAPRPLPADILDGATAGGVSGLDRPQEGRGVLADKVRQAFEAARRVPTCIGAASR